MSIKRIQVCSAQLACCFVLLSCRHCSHYYHRMKYLVIRSLCCSSQVTSAVGILKGWETDWAGSHGRTSQRGGTASSPPTTSSLVFFQNWILIQRHLLSLNVLFCPDVQWKPTKVAASVKKGREKAQNRPDQNRTKYVLEQRRLRSVFYRVVRIIWDTWATGVILVWSAGQERAKLHID